MRRNLHEVSEPMPPDITHFDGVRGPFQKIPASDYARVFKGSLNISGRLHHFYLKQYLYRSAWDFAKHVFRPGRAMRSFKATLLLTRNGLSAPEVIAVGEERRLLFCTRSFVITSSLRRALPLYLWLGRLAPDDPRSRRKRRALLRRLGRTIGRMHSLNISHGDLRPGNILASEVGGNWTFNLLDNERTRLHRNLPHSMRIKNLVQIGMLHEEYLSQTDRTRFFTAYINASGRLKPSERELARIVHQTTMKRLRSKPHVPMNAISD